MALIDQTYFVYDISLPAGNYADLQGWIDRFEPDVLRDLMGSALSQLVLDYDPATSDQRIKDIVEGADFVIDDVTYHWDGLLNTQKKSLIAYYVYTQYLRYNITTTTPTGEKKSKNENSQPADQSIKMWRAHQKFFQQAATLILFFNTNIDAYPEYIKPDSIPGGNLNAFDL